MFRSTLRHTQPICKINFAKIRIFVFFLSMIRNIAQKYIIFAPCFKKQHKITKKN